MAEMVKLRETFRSADLAKLQAALAIVVKDIKLFWTAGGPRKWRFDRGVITLGDALLPSLPSPKTAREETDTEIYVPESLVAE